jgi:hypothetical protein
MRKLPKYKLYNKVKAILKFPVRILKFKRSKWNKLKESIDNNNIFKKNKIFDIGVIKNELKVWKKVKRVYKERLQLYSLLKIVFDNSIDLNKLKQFSVCKQRKSRLIKNFLKEYYKICGLLWISNCYASNSEVRQKINSNVVFINNKRAFSNICLKKGDIINIKDCTIRISKNFKKYNLIAQILSYIEIDYYSQTITILKDIDELSDEDFYLLFTTYIDSINLK